MRKRKGSSKSLASSASASSSTSSSSSTPQEHGFFACYLLASLNPRFKGHTYIGFTVNPRRRIRQHNGEIGCGAWRTKKKRPWEMVLCIYGFPTNVAALQFKFVLSTLPRIWASHQEAANTSIHLPSCELFVISSSSTTLQRSPTSTTLPGHHVCDIDTLSDDDSI
ncbi:hypothetical protein S83_034291 [Arachis hypogaea]